MAYTNVYMGHIKVYRDMKVYRGYTKVYTGYIKVYRGYIKVYTRVYTAHIKVHTGNIKVYTEHIKLYRGCIKVYRGYIKVYRGYMKVYTTLCDLSLIHSSVMFSCQASAADPYSLVGVCVCSSFCSCKMSPELPSATTRQSAKSAVRCRQNCHLQQHVSPQSQLSDVARTAICNNTSVRKVSCQMSPELPSATTRQSAKSAVRCRQNCHLQQHVSPQSQLSRRLWLCTK